MENKVMNDTNPIREACEEYRDYVNSDKYCEDGEDRHVNAIFEAAIDCYIGPGFWDIVNSKDE